MNLKKDSKRGKPKTQGMQQFIVEKFQQPISSFRNIEQSLMGLDLGDISALRPIYDSLSLSTHVRNDAPQMQIIQTPANFMSRKSYLEQIDETYKPIEAVIQWSNQSCSQYDDDHSQEQSASNSAFNQPSEFQEESHIQTQSANNIPVNQKQSNVRNENIPTEAKEKIKKMISPAPRPTAKPQNGKKIFCNCKKTKCLKLYCDCFRDGQICGEGCNCQDCHNLESYEDMRNNSMWSLMERNPDAFKPKIQEKQHSKGCHCKKSQCLKKYCQCFQAGLSCGEHCKCEDCKNGMSCISHKQKEQENNILRTTAKKQKRFNQWITQK